MSESATSFLSGENNLCSACASIDFDAFVHHAKDVVGKSLAEIDERFVNRDGLNSPFALLVCDDDGAVEMVGIEVDHVESASDCPCYEIFKILKFEGSHTYLVYYLYPSQIQHDQRMTDKKLARSQLKVCCLPEVDRKPSPSYGRMASKIKFSETSSTFEFVQPGEPEPELSADLSSIKSVLAREACPHQIKSGRVQDWERLFRRGLPGWSVIDCFANEIVNLEDCVASAGSFDAVEYATLSYVWGSAQSDCLRPGRKLPASVPRVIEDAKTVAATLGFQYLWVDRYCIPQHCAKDAHDQIRNMNLVYARSCITIIAAAGQSPDYGLPGVGKTTREVFHTFQIGSHTIRWVPPNAYWAEQQIQHSKWNTRAWTCQEAALSTRRLYFTDHFALLENGKEGESYIEGLPNQLCPKNGTAWDGLYKLGSIPNAGSYATRELSFEADVEYEEYFVPTVQVSLRYTDGFTFKWASMMKERIYKLIQDRDEGTIEFILVTGLTFGFKALWSMSREEVYIARAGSRANTSQGPTKAYVQWPSLHVLDETARESYGITQEELSDESQALCLCMGSSIESRQGHLCCLGLVSSDGGSTWQRLDVFKIWFEDSREHVCPEAFGWDRRELRIR
ncbi:HET-domain-containing protein [Colletotrichum scovillei]|uniref:HET-domain-containing protein n=1 Tax=Colletotrichum scovillei TaxID=1209932 RepID=A0A9P7RJR5_9PEZI|nr:HET-domain-containing protein [Colletotrichum scovillei]KAG7076845.1 HET-domain-containing protein [Colletotrichum scovillei]KAG7083809.1 HET-domain-containing protein [Colletotrichum scovillei]